MEAIELSVPSMRTVFGLFRLLFMMMILAHMQACVFFLMAKQNINNSWVCAFVRVQLPICVCGCCVHCGASLRVFAGAGAGAGSGACCVRARARACARAWEYVYA